MSQENVEVVRRSFEAFNARDVDELVSLFAEDCELLPFRAQLEGIVYRGHEGLRRFVRDMDEDWQGFRVDPVEFHDRQARVAVVGRVSALGRGSRVEVDSLAGFVFELHDGRIRHVTSHSEPGAALEAVEVRE
jgi:ketosteroid isomerase-like protein